VNPPTSRPQGPRGCVLEVLALICCEFERAFPGELVEPSSPTELRRVERVRILPAYRGVLLFLRLVGRWGFTIRWSSVASSAPMTELDDLPRPGREPTTTLEAKA
jgi:hypothetical protein